MTLVQTQWTYRLKAGIKVRKSSFNARLKSCKLFMFVPSTKSREIDEICRYVTQRGRCSIRRAFVFTNRIKTVKFVKDLLVKHGEKCPLYMEKYDKINERWH